jgi:putative membrane protein
MNDGLVEGINMKQFILRWAVLMVAVFVSAQLSFLGIHYDSLASLATAALVLSVINTFIKPVLMIITLPFILLSFGLLVLVINAFLFYLAGAMVEGFHVESFSSALGGALIVSLISFLLNTDRQTVIVHQRSRYQKVPPGRGPVIDV